MKKISIKGVLVGGVTDIVATNILTLPILIYATNKLDLARASPEQLQAALHANAFLYVLQLLIGFGCSALGGYVAAWLAKHDELLNGPLSSFLCIAFGIYSLAAKPVSMLVSLLFRALRFAARWPFDKLRAEWSCSFSIA